MFTRKSADAILDQGGSGHWILNRRKARACQYVVCVRNAKSADVGAHEPHGSAFLIGEIRDINRADVDSRGNHRSLIAFIKHARVNLPNVWQEWRNPVRYTTMEDLGIDVLSLSMHSHRVTLTTAKAKTPSLTIFQAKQGLAATFGVDPEAIEIIIRG